jgi:cyclophilin family peptidyl-prolyl cis-trans isomerase
MVGSKLVVCLVSIIILVGSISFLSFTTAKANWIKIENITPMEENFTDECQENRIAEIDTTYGVITIELYEKRAPITSSNFINLSIAGFYDGILFHRVIDDFVIQTGDPNTKDNNPYNDGSGGSSQTIPLEIDPELTHVDGAVGMARSSEPDSASSQFYICDGPQHGLDGDYAVFGVTIDGIDVVRKIAQVDTYGNKRPLLKDHPIEDVVMYSVFITENDSEYHYTPTPDDNDLWFDDSSNSVPGFNGILIIASIAATVLLIKRKRIRK